MEQEYQNPFTPTFGYDPAILAGRTEIMQIMRRAFAQGRGAPDLSTILIGARGTGKTVLLNAIEDEALAEGWLSANVTANPGMLEDVYEQSAKAAAEFLAPEKSHVTGVTIGNILGVQWERGETFTGNWRTRMGEILDVLAEKDIGLLITVDEVDASLDELVHLSADYQHFVREKRKIALVMAGLPRETAALLRDKTVSFLRRSAQYRLGRISDSDMLDALVQTVREGGKALDAEAASTAVRGIDGYPYMMQLVGYHMFNASEGPRIGVDDVTQGIELALHDMRSRIYESTLADLSPKDIQLLLAMGDDGSISLTRDVIERSGMNEKTFSVYRKRLIDQGVIGDRGRGKLGLDLPGFKSYVEEVMA